MTPKKDGNIFKILQISINSASMEGVLGLISQRLSRNQRTFIVTPNPEFLIYAQQNPWFKGILTHSDIAIPDGIALLWAGQVIKGNNFFSRLIIGFWTGLKVIFVGWGKKRVTGTDLMAKLCQLAAKKGWSIYLLGGKERIAEKTLKILQAKSVGLRGWAESGPQLTLKSGIWSQQSEKKADQLIKSINAKSPDLLFVAYTMDKQLKFIKENWPKLKKVKMAMGVGGAFNYLSGEVKRAPQWIQNMGFEWLYRLMKEPWRWRRQLKLIGFILLILKGR